MVYFCILVQVPDRGICLPNNFPGIGEDLVRAYLYQSAFPRSVLSYNADMFSFVQC